MTNSKTRKDVYNDAFRAISSFALLLDKSLDTEEAQWYTYVVNKDRCLKGIPTAQFLADLQIGFLPFPQIKLSKGPKIRNTFMTIDICLKGSITKYKKYLKIDCFNKKWYRNNKATFKEAFRKDLITILTGFYQIKELYKEQNVPIGTIKYIIRENSDEFMAIANSVEDTVNFYNRYQEALYNVAKWFLSQKDYGVVIKPHQYSLGPKYAIGISIKNKKKKGE